jgi:hypothetical protein
VTLGIQNAVAATLEKAKVDKSRIQAIAIGTTSFVNSLIERNAEKLERVALGGRWDSGGWEGDLPSKSSLAGTYPETS